LLFQAIDDLNPSAISLRIGLAFSVLGPTARPVQQALGAHGHWANTARDSQVTLVAGLAALGPNARTFRHANEAGVYSRKNWNIRIHFSEELYARAASEGDYRIYFGYSIPEKLQEFPVALAFHRGGSYLQWPVFGGRREFQLSGKDPGFLFPACQAYCDTRAAPCHEHSGVIAYHGLDFGEGFGLGDDHAHLRFRGFTIEDTGFKEDLSRIADDREVITAG
jgi:hypothetical protein